MFVYDALGDKRLEKFIVGYYAVDCDIINAQTFNSLAYCNAKVTYTRHGKQVIEGYRPDMDGLVNVIPLACEPDVFYPLSEEERRKARKELFYVEDDATFMVINVNRNQARKDLGRTLDIFHQFHRKHPNSKLYMHSKQDDIGGHLPTMARMIGMEPGREVLFADERFHVLQGFTRDYLNKVYNAADCLMSTSLGEGWGLTTTEAMASCTPVVVPNNTAFTEIVGADEERGFLVKSGGDVDHMQWLYKTTNHPHSIVHSEDMIQTLDYVYYVRNDAKARAREAREWTLQHTREIIKDQWKEFFSEAEKFIQSRAKVNYEVC
jgi:glycosyltransferase involved in cell wall biosynthesis